MIDKRPGSKIPSAFKKAEPYLNISYTLLGAIALFGYIGHRFDERLGVHPYLMLIGILVGLALGYYNMIKVIHSLEKK